MYDYSAQLETFQASRVALPTVMRQRLYAHRKANRDRLIGRLKQHLPGVTVTEGSFYPQGSVAMKTVVQTLFDDEEYDIDDGLVLARGQLLDADGHELSVAVVRDRLKAALQDGRFKKQPTLMTNCVRVFYADEGAAKHHVDIPVYRHWIEDSGSTIRELAGQEGWIVSDPTQVNRWFDALVSRLNSEADGSGTQLRRVVRLLKRFCRSREDWLDLLPNGMKLTMLAAECHRYDERLDVAFRALLSSLKDRLATSKVIRNLAHPDQPAITRSNDDPNVKALLSKVDSALDILADLDRADSTLADARAAWDWLFQSQGFFEQLDEAFEARILKDSVGASEPPSQLPWVEDLPWPVVERHRVQVSARHSLKTYGWRSFDNGAPVAKGVSLRFDPKTDVQGEHRIYWQVVNTGSDARRARCMRGEILEPSDAKTGSRNESTQYTGRHWVECFVVQNEICVARSGRFFVVIEE